MPYYYDQFVRIAKKEGKTFEQVSKDFGAPYSTSRKWEKREPHKKYKQRLDEFIIEHLSDIPSFGKPNDTETSVSQTAISITYDENGIPDNFWNSLKQKYLLRKKGSDNWNNEVEGLKSAIIAIVKSLGGKYRLIEPIAHGGTAVVLKIEDTSLGIYRALKFPRPIEKHIELFTNIITTEINLLAEATHANIVEIYEHYSVDTINGKCPFYIMKFVKGAQSADEYFSQQRTDLQLFKVIEQIALGINYLHSLSIIHLDIKPENILVSSDGDALLSDLGSARRVMQQMEKIPIIYTKDYAHPTVRALNYYETSDSNRCRSEIERQQIHPKFDIYSFGKTVLNLLGNFDPYLTTKRMPAYSRKYLQLLGCRALDGENTADEIALGLSPMSFRELKYKSMEEILDDIEKFKGSYPLGKKVPELNPFIVDTIQAGSIWKTPLTNRLKELLKQPSMQRLAGVSQLGLLIQIYPTATHTRLQHTLGTFSNTIKIIEALYQDEINPLFRQIMSADDINCALLAALLHDIGHFPLAHDLHEALPKVFNPDEVGFRILRGTEKWYFGESLRATIEKDWNVTSHQIADILEARPSETAQPFKNRILHTIIDGPIDADKLDYLVRDSRTLGIPYSNVIDFERLLNCLTTIFKPEGNRTYVALGIHEKGKIAAESVAFARYAMHQAVYAHHTFRAIKAMLHRAVWECHFYSFPGPKGDTNLLNAFSSRFFATPKAPSMLDKQQLYLDELTQVLPSDREVLGWLYDNTTSNGKQLVEALNKRELFKRIFVFSFFKSTIWRDLIDFRAKKPYEDILKLQNKLQELIVDFIDNIPDEDRKKDSILTPENTELIVVRHKEKKIIVLIDIPLEQTDGDRNLEYLPESSRHNVKETWIKPAEVEPDSFWTQLHKDFTNYVGKVRVFAHPEIADVLAAAIEPSVMEKLVDRARLWVIEGKHKD